MIKKLSPLNGKYELSFKIIKKKKKKIRLPYQKDSSPILFHLYWEKNQEFQTLHRLPEKMRIKFIEGKP